MQRLTSRRARPARVSDAAAIAELVNGFAAEGLMLPRTVEMIALAIDDYVVITNDRGRLRACGALREYSPSVAEVAAIAVARDAQGLGLGREVVRAVEALAIRRGIGEVFALTLAPGLFEALGYGVVDRAAYPEKMRRDCARCP